jgi:ribonucleoside-diphosphate reductase beta chain
MSDQIESKTEILENSEISPANKQLEEILLKKIVKYKSNLEKPVREKQITEEPMLVVDNNRFTLFPIKHHDIWLLFKKHERAIWHAEELDYHADKEDYVKLTNDEKFFIENILAFFAGADGIVMENLMSNFSKEIQWPEVRAFYSIQGFMEQVHSETYSLLIDTYISDSKKKEKLFKAIDEIPCVKRKAEWALKWMDPKTASFAERLVAFAVVEGIFFSGSFCAIFWLKSRGIMCKALGKSNEFISRDENLHCELAILLYNKLKHKLTKDRIYEIFKEAIEIETNFIIESIPCKLVGMNSNLMTKYIKYVSSFWMHQLLTTSGKHCPKLYNVKNPFPFMDMIGIDGKSNFFEQRPTEYAKPKIDKQAFNEINDDF